MPSRSAPVLGRSSPRQSNRRTFLVAPFASLLWPRTATLRPQQNPNSAFSFNKLKTIFLRGGGICSHPPMVSTPVDLAGCFVSVASASC